MIATALAAADARADDEEAIRVGEEALAMAEELGLDEVKAAALVNIGSSGRTSGTTRRARE